MVKKWWCNVKEGNEERKEKSAVSKVLSLLLRAVAPFVVFSRVCTRFPSSIVEVCLVAVAVEEQRCSCRLQEVLRSCFFLVCVREGFRRFLVFGFWFLVFTLLPELSLWIEVLLVWSRNLHGRIPMR